MKRIINDLISLCVPVFSSLQVLATDSQPPNILFIVAEDASPDLRCYGNEYVYTPNLDRLATEGVRFGNAYTTYSVSSPSRGSIFTGLYPHQNGQIGLATHRYEMFEGIITLPIYMKQLGYKTGCIGKIHVNPESAIPFDYWEIRSSNFAKKHLEDYAVKAKEFVSSDDKPYFLMVNFPDAHYPFQKQVEGKPSCLVETGDVRDGLPFVGIDSDKMRQLTANYYNCINRLDESVGFLLNTLDEAGKLDNTYIFFISDHGAQFSRGKHSNYEGGLKIPFILKTPDRLLSGCLRNELVSVIDLLPTFIAIGGGEVPGFLPGRNLLDLFIDYSNEWRTYLFADGMGAFPQVHFPQRSVRDKRYKLIYTANYRTENPHFSLYSHRVGHFAPGTTESEIDAATDSIKEGYHVWHFPPQYELYDLKNDPNEWHNLANDLQYADVLGKLKYVLHDWRINTKDMIVYPEKLEMINQEMRKTYENKKKHDYQKDDYFHYRYIDYLNPNKQ